MALIGADIIIGVLGVTLVSLAGVNYAVEKAFPVKKAHPYLKDSHPQVIRRVEKKTVPTPQPIKPVEVPVIEDDIFSRLKPVPGAEAFVQERIVPVEEPLKMPIVESHNEQPPVPYLTMEQMAHAADVEELPVIDKPVAAKKKVKKKATIKKKKPAKKKP